jgi:hypothetical protein
MRAMELPLVPVGGRGERRQLDAHPRAQSLPLLTKRCVIPTEGSSRATLGAEYEVQCRQLCLGPYPSWSEIRARFEELKGLL